MCWRDQRRNDSNVDKDVTHGSYKSLRLILNQISVFADRNPLELAGVQYNDSDEILLPALETRPDEPTSTDVDPSENVTAVGDSHTAFEESLVNLPPTVTEPSIPGLNTPLNVTDHLRPLTNVLWHVRPRWYHLGIQLNIDQPTLEVIKFDCRDSVDDCFTSVLTHFLKRDQPSPTFADLVTALQSPPVDQLQLVDRIRELASKELGGVQCKDIDENMLPALESIVTEPSRTAGSQVATDDSDSECTVIDTHTDTQELANAEFNRDSDGNQKQDIEQTVHEHPITRDSAIEELKRECGVSDEQLNTRIREEHLHDLAGCFDQLETYLDRLGLNPAQQTDIHDLATQRGIQIAMAQALKLWRQPKPWLATYRALVEILLDLRRGDVADRVCQYIKQEIPKHK